MADWTIIDTIYVVTQMLLVSIYRKFVDTRDSRNKIKFATRCILNRLFAVGALCLFFMERFGMFGRERYSMMAFSIWVFWFTFLLISMLSSDGWCCEKCGRRIGLRVLFVSKCPYCG